MKTAVEWLVSELKKYDSAGLKDQSNYVIEMPTHILTELEEQAKEMEKEQQGYSDEHLECAWNSSEKNMRFQFSSSAHKAITFKQWLEVLKKIK